MATATAQPFSLFPTSVPKIALPNPHNRQRSLHKVHSFKLQDIQPKSSQGLEIAREPPLPHLPKDVAYTKTRSRTPSPDYIGYAITTCSPIDGSTSSPSLAQAAQKFTPPNVPKEISKSSSPEPSSGISGAATLVQPIPPQRGQEVSPIVPIQSMFPRYNPSVPLNEQSYYPQRPYPMRMSSITRNNISREEYRASLQSPFDRAVGIRTAPASVVNFPVDLSNINEPRFSSHRELEKLWQASHGTEPNGLITSFDLEMARSSEATFTFGADPGFPFYSLTTFDTNEISISKTNPRKRTASRDIVMTSLEPTTRRLSPNDGLVAFIFPKLAAMLALNQSAALAKEHNLASTDREDIEQAAVRRAAEQEACRLIWNPSSRCYELEHPSIGRNARDPDFMMTPISPLVTSPSGKPVVHIMVSSNSTGNQPATTASPPVIIVTNPNVSRTPNESAGAGIRLSTLPQSDIDAPLASLDLGSLTMHINADAILKLMPSLFAIDSVVSAMLAIAVADEVTNPVLAAMPIWMPRPKAPGSQFGGSVKSYAGSVLYATIAEREEAEEEATKMRKEHEKDVRSKKKTGKEEAPRTWYGKTRKEKSQRKQIIVGEFDLEKLGHYQSGDRKGEELPSVTRGLLAGMIMGLKFVVWLLTLVVQFLAWILVNVSRAVTSEKF